MKQLRYRSLIGLLGPFFLCFVLFWLVPLIGGVRLSFYANTLVGEGSFVGFDHYRALLDDARYFKAIRNTSIYALGSLLCILPLSLVLAHALQSLASRWRSVIQFVLLVPGLTPPAVLALLFLLVFHGRAGLLNQWFVMPLGGQPINWLKDPDVILAALVLQCIWRWLGFITFFVHSGMQAIPSMYYEALQIESRHAWHRFWWVTLPGLRHVLLFCLIYLIVDAFALFSGAYVLLGGSGGTADAGLMLVSYLYQSALTFGRFGSAAAMGIAIAPCLLGILGLMAWFGSKYSRQTGGSKA
jgi:ABC-type sugar transport system permease subunit